MKTGIMTGLSLILGRPLRDAPGRGTWSQPSSNSRHGQHLHRSRPVGDPVWQQVSRSRSL